MAAVLSAAALPGTSSVPAGALLEPASTILPSHTWLQGSQNSLARRVLPHHLRKSLWDTCDTCQADQFRGDNMQY